MANQCEHLVRLLRADGVSVELVRTKPPYRPRWIGSVPVLRVLHSAKLANALRRPGLEQAARYAWPRIRARWLAAYSDVVRGREAS